MDQQTPTPQERAKLRKLSREAAREFRRRDKRREDMPDGARVASPSPSRGFLVRVRRIGLVAIGAAVLIAIVYPPFLIPVRGPTTSRFFIRNAPDSDRLFDFEHHTGIDIGAPSGTRVMASRSGRVVATGSDPDYGIYVDVRHPLGWRTRYAHLSAASVHEGQWIWRRGTIGSVGMTGRTTGPHLHFEIRVGNRPVPPGLFLLFHGIRRSITG